MTGKRTSAGLLPFRWKNGSVKVFLVHPGGPYWAKKDDGAWSIAKGELAGEEDALAAAKREFAEETGIEPNGAFLPLTAIKQVGGKIVQAWAVRMDFEASAIRSNTFTMEWPARSGREQTFPEVDRGEWFDLEMAETKILAGQRPLLTQVAHMLTEGRLSEARSSN